jgi:hypothetical protein
MKYLKSSLQDLRELFDGSITVREIAESLTSFDADCDAALIRQFMESKDYDVVGVRQDGLVSGYVNRVNLTGGRLVDHMVQFNPEGKLLEKSPLVNVFEALNHSSRAFVVVLGEVGGIVTRGDLQKAPVRMWLFGLISLIEMQLLRIIREFFQIDSWQPLISPKRLEKAKSLLEERQRRNEGIDLADCIQFADKRDIVLKNDKLRHLLEIKSKEEGKQLFENLENLRNDLAHAQDIITGNWPRIVELAKESEALLGKLEVVTG